MNKYTAIATVTVALVTGIIAALAFKQPEIALGLITLGGSLAVALGVHQYRKQPNSEGND